MKKNNNKKEKKKSKKKESKIDIFSIMKESIDNMSLSILTLILGPFYLFYKKIYGPALITILLYIFTSMYLTFELSILSKILINIFIAFKYKKEVETNDSLHISILIYILLIYVLILNLVTYEKDKDYKSTENRIDNITYKIPNTVKETKSNKKSKYYSLNNLKNGNCFITISINNSNMYSIPEEYISNSQKYETKLKKGKFNKKTINKIEWTNQKLSNKKNIKDIYVTKQDNNFYEIRFESTNSNKDLCSKVKKDILKSVKIKKMK